MIKSNMSIKTFLAPTIEIETSDNGLADAEKWWFRWMLSAEIDITSASSYSITFARKNLDPSHLMYFTYEILKDIGIKSIGDRLKILRRSTSYFNELRHRPSNKNLSQRNSKTQINKTSSYAAIPSSKSSQMEIETMSSSSTYFLNLPREIISLIFHQLSLSHWCKLSQVCSSFHRIINSISWWRSIESLHISPRTCIRGDRFLSHIVPQLSKLTSLAVRGNLFSDQKKISTMLQHCTGLTSLVIREDEVTFEVVQSIGNYCKNLEYLSLEYMQTDNISPILQNCKKIKSLSLFQLGFSEETVISSIAETYNSQLLELCLDEFGGSVQLKPIALHCKNLKKLSLNYIDNPIMGVEYLIQGCSNLETLLLMGADVHLFSYPPQGECFDLALLPQYLVNLKELWINKLLNQQADFVKLLSEKNWPSLTLLSLGSFEYVHFPEIEHILLCNQQLKSLLLYDCSNLKSEDVSDLKGMFPNVSFYHASK